MISRKLRVYVGAGTVLVAIALLVLLHRDTDDSFARSITESGDELYRFTGALPPRLPATSKTPSDFSDLIDLLELESFRTATAVSQATDSVRWLDGEGREIRVQGKTCPDSTWCVDSVIVHPFPDERLRNIAAAFDNARLVTPQDYDAWPFTVDQAVLLCSPPKALTLVAASGTYALNAQARSETRQSIDEILRDHPLKAGEKQSFGPVFFDAIALCGQDAAPDQATTTVSGS